MQRYTASLYVNCREERFIYIYISAGKVKHDIFSRSLKSMNFILPLSFTRLDRFSKLNRLQISVPFADLCAIYRSLYYRWLLYPLAVECHTHIPVLYARIWEFVLFYYKYNISICSPLSSSMSNFICSQYAVHVLLQISSKLPICTRWLHTFTHPCTKTHNRKDGGHLSKLSDAWPTHFCCLCPTFISKRKTFLMLSVHMFIPMKGM